MQVQGQGQAFGARRSGIWNKEGKEGSKQASKRTARRSEWTQLRRPRCVARREDRDRDRDRGYGLGSVVIVISWQVTESEGTVRGIMYKAKLLLVPLALYGGS
ncbi:hypothetical protein DM02DRAFT_154414 [Periconia macrospinosa]|uniref:Uncharacterized protein n=1 Tax=Periconia macrospinosa TaxID=97972 RepID=A0A2V1EFT1_9PLEO|nr:hypothetical protein DM02DRAFT_154414 [Periconia macrospinosa]